INMHNMIPPFSLSQCLGMSAILRVLPTALIFSFLTVSAAVSFAEEPVYVDVKSGKKLIWPTIQGGSYQVQWSADPEDEGSWTDLGDPRNGDGNTASLVEFIPQNARFYRVVEVLPATAA